jgi:TolB-like 6-blade propeller-like
MKSLRFLIAVLGPVLVLATGMRVYGWIVHTPAPTPPKPAAMHATPRPVSEAPSRGTLSPLREVTKPGQLFMPTGIAATPSILAALDPMNGTMPIAIIDPRTGESRDPTQSLGAAAKELHFSVIQPAGERAFFLSDPSQMRIARLVLDEHDASQATLGELAAERSIVSVLPLSRDLVVLSGLFPDRLLSIRRIAGGRLTPETEVGTPLFPEVTAPKVAANLNRNVMARDPASGRIVAAFLFSSRLHVYTPSGALERQIAGPIDVKLAYNVGFDTLHQIDKFMTHDDLRFCYVSVAADARYIYALFAGRAEGHFKTASAYGDQLQVFTWDGRSVGNWKLAQPARGIAVGGTPARLWALNAPPLPVIAEYDMSGIRPRDE